MASIMESDIDQFIQNQKAKLQQERQLLAVRFIISSQLT
jgi:hypothetical protein